MIRSFAEGLIAQGYGVAIDITSGRKVTVAGALIAISLAGIHINTSTTSPCRVLMMLQSRMMIHPDPEDPGSHGGYGSMNDVIIREDELQVLINSLDDIRISYPLYEGDFLIARPEGMGFHLDLPAPPQKTFREGLSGYEPIASELPSYSDFQECMLASGIVRYANQVAFGEVLTSYEHLKKTVYFGLDTNLFYHCFVTNNPEINHTSYLVVDTVRDEITYAVNRKYRAKRIEEMVACSPDHRDLIVELENKRTKRSRKAAYLALREYRVIRDRAAAIPSPAPHSHLSERTPKHRSGTPEVRGGTIRPPGPPDPDIYMADPTAEARVLLS